MLTTPISREIFAHFANMYFGEWKPAGRRISNLFICIIKWQPFRSRLCH